MDKKTRLLFNKIQSDGEGRPISYWMPDSMTELIRHVAKKEGISASQFVRQSVKNHIFGEYIAANSRQKNQRE